MPLIEMLESHLECRLSFKIWKGFGCMDLDLSALVVSPDRPNLYVSNDGYDKDR